MAIPFVPFVAGALMTYATLQAIPKLRRNQQVEDALDAVEEGIATRRDAQQVNATGRMRRVLHFGRKGPRVEVDAVALARVRVRKV